MSDTTEIKEIETIDIADTSKDYYLSQTLPKLSNSKNKLTMDTPILGEDRTNLMMNEKYIYPIIIISGETLIGLMTLFSNISLAIKIFIFIIILIVSLVYYLQIKHISLSEIVSGIKSSPPKE